jgi:type IV pilus assembly protein PilM
MSAFDSILKPLRRFEPDALLHLRPAYPPVAVEIDRGQLALVRLKARRRSRPQLEAFRVQEAPEHAVGNSIFRPNLGSLGEMTDQLRDLFQRSGTKPGRVSLILPDNLAKVSIVTLPERPASRQLMSELLRFKLRRSVPFRLEDAVVSSDVLPGPGPEVNVLVAVMLRSVVEQYETAFEAVGARPGLVDLCTPSLFNLVRRELLASATEGSDAALLNCTRNYFTLMIARAGRVVFFRCKTYAGGEEDDPSGRLAVMGRELGSSLSYYQDKLAGTGIGTLFVRAVAPGLDEVAPVLERLGVASIRPIDPAAAVDAVNGSRFDLLDGQRLAPALGAVSGKTAA